MTMESGDKAILRHLAEQVAELAARPVEDEKRQLWRDHNELRTTRPVIFCDPENGWNEIIRRGSLSCSGDLARGWEWLLRREIFWGKCMKDDRVIEPYWNIAHVVTQTGWGMDPKYTKGENGGSYVWEAPLRSYDQFDQLKYPTIDVNWQATNDLLDLAWDVFSGLLEVRLKNGWHWTLGLTQTAAVLRGLEQIMIDMVDEPENLHRLMAFLRDAAMAKLDFLEEGGLLSLNNDGAYVGSGGFGWTTELPAKDFAGKVRTKDLWCLSESQETVGVSPAMFARFVLPYQLPLMSRFGFVCYGCCEPVDKRWKYLKEIPNLRRVSVSPWADIAVMAENLQDRYVYSLKPNPADLATNLFPEDRIRQQLRSAMQITRGCRVEVIMKDCHTIGNDPDHVIRWTRIAREEAERL